MNTPDVVIVAARRTPIGSMLGNLSGLTAPELGSHAHTAVLKDTNINPELIHEVISGCVLQAGLGQAPARQAAIKANIPISVGATTINKMCGSGLKSVMLGVDAIHTSPEKIILASGMESMSRAPYLLEKARQGYRLGHGKLMDSMFLDGLEDAYDHGTLMGVFADQTAQKYEISREDQDAYAVLSMQRALDAQKQGFFNAEITPIHTTISKEQVTIERDESPDIKKIDKITKLRPAFGEHGTVTAANSSSIADGAASVLLMSSLVAANLNIKPLARVIAHSAHAQEPAWFTTAPVGAIKKLLHQTGWAIQDVDLFEINEAFAVVSLVAIQELKLDINKVNVHGGACALGHPIGASGTRILVTLIHALVQRHKKRGIAALCIGGGEAVAIAVEIL